MATLPDKRLQQLANKFLKGTLTEAEQKEFDAWFHAQPDEPQDVPAAFGTAEEQRERLFARIQAQTLKQAPVRRLWPRIAGVAASIALIAGAYLVLHQTKQPVRVAQNDVKPFTQQATLKTGHGKTLILDTTTNKTLAQYAQARIRQIKGGQIAYNSIGSAQPSETMVYDTLHVPAGGKPVHLQLPDGSQLIADVATDLRIPENFRKGGNAITLLSGQAFFDIHHNPDVPVIVLAKNQEIKDIGTEFNVSAYDDEADSRTTLVEGKVAVNHTALQPGEVAISNGSGLKIETADLEQTLSWTKGYFRFNGENIQTVMRELARAYNIEVHYEGKISAEGYYIKVARSKNISEVLKALERTNSVHFKIEGRRVTVLSK